MSGLQIRTLESGDFPAIMRLEQEILGAEGESLLGPYYVRLCCEFFDEHCFLALEGDEPVGYLLSFVCEREAYCTTLAILPRVQGRRVAHLLIRAFVPRIIHGIDRCWFTVEAGNTAARALHSALGARELGVRRDFYGPGDERIVSCIDTEAVGRLRRRYERLRLLSGAPTPARRPTSSLATGWLQ